MKHFLILWVLLLSMADFAAFGIDKRRARKHQWRISEASLLGLAAAGGAFGGLIGMSVFHHKTRKWKFRIWIPVFCLCWLIVLVSVETGFLKGF